MSEISYLELAKAAAPEIIVLLTALVVLGIDLLVVREQGMRTRTALCAMFATAGCAVAIVWLLAISQDVSLAWTYFETTPLVRAVKAGVLGLAIFCLWLSRDSSLTRHTGEYFSLVLFSTTGMMLLASSRDLLTIFLSLELSTIPLYALAAFHKDSATAANSSLRYFLFGSMSAAITLFGFSLLYGFSGSINLSEIAAAAETRASDPLFLAGSVLVIGGMGFKIAAAPFHLWAPEIYHSAPFSSAAFISSASKVAGIFILGIVLISGLSGAPAGDKPTWAGVLMLIAAVSILVGNAAAVVQADLRRLLAFSAVAHAGYMLMALLANNSDGLAAVFYYAVTYGLATLGAFAVIALAGASLGAAPNLNGLHTKSPLLAGSMLVFMLSLAGIPPLAGFFGKFVVFVSFMQAAPLDGSRVALLLLALAASAVSLYYYLKVLKYIYVLPPDPAPLSQKSGVTAALVALMAILLVVLGVAPQAVLRTFLDWHVH